MRRTQTTPPTLTIPIGGWTSQGVAQSASRDPSSMKRPASHIIAGEITQHGGWALSIRGTAVLKPPTGTYRCPTGTIMMSILASKKIRWQRPMRVFMWEQRKRSIKIMVGLKKRIGYTLGLVIYPSCTNISGLSIFTLHGMITGLSMIMGHQNQDLFSMMVSWPIQTSILRTVGQNHWTKSAIRLLKKAWHKSLDKKSTLNDD